MKPLTAVLKLGTSTLTLGSRHLNKAQMLEIVRSVYKLKCKGHKVILVSSGAVAAGREVLGDPKLPDVLSSKQLLASVGQGQLMAIYEDMFSYYKLHIGQILLTRADLENRERFLNAKDALNALIEQDVIPIINENDAVSTQEIRVGDNDNLAALTGILCDADLIILLTDQKGLYDKDPRTCPDAKLIKKVSVIDEQIEAIAGGTKGGLGTGGMATKVKAAKTAVMAGIPLVIAAGQDPSIVLSLVEGKGEGTFFEAAGHALWAKKSWLSAATRPQGSITVDDGAAQALLDKGSSLLPSGIALVDGQFLRGAVVGIHKLDGTIIAQGIARYGSDDLKLIKGHRSDEIEKTLGYSHGAAAVHRDDLVLIG